MAFEKIVPRWNAQGAEPPESLKNSGFTSGYKPPADYFNWFWHDVSECLAELQKGAMPLYLGANPINEESDTVAAWVALGTGYARYTNAGTLIDKPSTYGILVSFCVAGNDIFQLWYDAPSGPMYHRGGNASGWYGTWKKVYDDTYKPTLNDILPGVLPISKGGTNASTRKDAYRNLGFLGTNPISTPANDTVAKWVELGSGFAWYSTSGQLTNQPSNYGLLLSFAPNAYEITQIWKSHATGPMYIRSGNAQGWGQQWTKIYDTLNPPNGDEIGGVVPIDKGGTGATTSTVARTNLGAAPAYTYSTTDLTAGTSALETGKIHLVYE